MTASSAFNPRWEEEIYARGRQLNRYPFPCFIGPFFGLFGRVPDRSRIEVCEVGCGAGNNVWFFAREGYATHGIDGSASALAYARTRLAAEGLAADLRQGDFQELPWSDATFDFVLDRGSITHNAKSAVIATIDAVSRVLKSEGWFFSQMYSTDHSDRKFARDYQDGSAADFSEGYFAGIGRTFFASRSDLDDLFAPRFEIRSIYLETFESALTSHVDAMWNVLMKKRG